MSVLTERDRIHEKALDLEKHVLQYIPKVDRSKYIEELVVEQRVERDVARVAAAASQRMPPPPPRLHEGFHIAGSPSVFGVFSHPASIGEGCDAALRKQRQAERRAIRQADKWLVPGAPPIGRKLPW